MGNLYMRVEIPEVRKALLELVREGSVVVSRSLKKGHVTFIAAQYATKEDQEHTEMWLKHPHFRVN